MLDKIKEIWTQLFTDEKFPDADKREAVGGKTIGDVYDMSYMPSPDNPGEMMVIFARKDEKSKNE